MTKGWTGACLAFAIMGSTLFAEQAPKAGPMDAAAAFERLKSLEGDWTGTAGAADAPGEQTTVRYHVTAAGAAVIETQFVGTDHEMVTVFHRDGDALVVTHYCASQHHPSLRLDAAASKADELRFVFADATNFDPAKDNHMREVTFRFPGQDRLQSDWTFYDKGKPAGTVRFATSRTPAKAAQ